MRSCNLKYNFFRPYLCVFQNFRYNTFNVIQVFGIFYGILSMVVSYNCTIFFSICVKLQENKNKDCIIIKTPILVKSKINKFKVYQLVKSTQLLF